MVGPARFELATYWSQTSRATKLRYGPTARTVSATRTQEKQQACARCHELSLRAPSTTHDRRAPSTERSVGSRLHPAPQKPRTAVPPLLNANIGVPASRLAPWL